MRRSRPNKCSWWAGQFILRASGIVAGVVADPLSSPFAFYVGVGFTLRLLSTPISIWGDQHVARMAAALPELSIAHNEYLALYGHPRAGHWDKQVAIKRLSSERERIFNRFGTSTMWLNAPPLVAGVCSAYFLSLVHNASAPEFISPLLLGVGLDLTPISAALVTYGNLFLWLQRRRGFSVKIDTQVDRYMRIFAPSLALACFVASSGTISSATCAAWLGMALCGLLRSALVSNGFTRHLLQIANYPPEHGSYGNLSTIEGHKYVMQAKQALEDPEGNKRWAATKGVIELDCDTRIYKLLRQFKFIHNDDDLVQAHQLLQKRIEAIQEASDKSLETGRLVVPDESSNK